MKILVFGSRDWIDEGMIYRVLSKLPRDTILVNGYARGADKIADKIARKLGFEVRTYPVSKEEWDTIGGAAGPERNQRMIDKEHPDAKGIRIDKAFGFALGPVTKTQNKGTHDMAERLWEARIRFDILSKVNAMQTLRDQVFESLDNALANDGLRFQGDGELIEQIAIDLGTHDADLEGLEPAELRPHIVAWMASKPLIIQIGAPLQTSQLKPEGFENGVTVRVAELPEDQVQAMLAQLRAHFGEPVMPVSRYCEAFRSWRRALEQAVQRAGTEDDGRYKAQLEGILARVSGAWLDVSKSNLLYRLLYLGEAVRTDPCPIHKGRWSGCVAPEQDCSYCMSGDNVTGLGRSVIRYLTGDATDPVGSGPKLIVHVCNSLGGWGKGFVLAVSRRWKDPERQYRRWHREGTDLLAGKFQLWAVQLVPVQGDPPLSVVNMIAQEGYGKGNRRLHRSDEPDDKPPIRYDALEQCLTEVGLMVKSGPAADASIHMPRIGCSLAGGRWSEVEPIIARTLRGAEVYVYDFPGSHFNA